MNNTNPIKKRWLVLIAALIMLSFSLKDFDFSQLEKLGFKDVLPVIILTAIVFYLKQAYFLLYCSVYKKCGRD